MSLYVSLCVVIYVSSLHASFCVLYVYPKEQKKRKKKQKNCYESDVLKEVLYVPLCVALCVSFNFFFEYVARSRGEGFKAGVLTQRDICSKVT